MVNNLCGYYQSANCVSQTAPIIIRKECNYKQSCTLLIMNSVLGGDPCPAVHKYAQVKYICVPGTIIYSMYIKKW